MAGFGFEGFEYVGLSEDGELFRNDEGLVFAVKVVVKKAGFDADYAVADFEAEQNRKAAEKADKDARKAARQNGEVKVVKAAK